MAKSKLDEQAAEILRMAEERGVQSNFFFATVFSRYLQQLKTLNELKKSMEEDGVLVTKEYVKGRKNVYIHPAVKEYNATCDSANRTVSTLMSILEKLGKQEDKGDDEDPLIKLINGSANE